MLFDMIEFIPAISTSRIVIRYPHKILNVPLSAWCSLWTVLDPTTCYSFFIYVASNFMIGYVFKSNTPLRFREKPRSFTHVLQYVPVCNRILYLNTVLTPVTSSRCVLVPDKCFGCPEHRSCHRISLPRMQQTSRTQGNNKETSYSFPFDP
jgi:hypothetical protein